MVDPVNVNDALANIEQLLEAGEIERAVHELRLLHPADSAEVLTWLDPTHRGYSSNN